MPESMLNLMFDTDYRELVAQTDRPDADSRMAALVEAFHRAVQTDCDCDGGEIVKALTSGNIEYLVTSLCGYGIHALAKMAMLERDVEYEHHDDAVKGKIIVRWTNGKSTTSKCSIDAGDHRVYAYAEKVMQNKWNDEAQIESVSIEVKPLQGGATYEFECVSKEEMKKTGGNTVYWYSPDFIEI